MFIGRLLAHTVDDGLSVTPGSIGDEADTLRNLRLVRSGASLRHCGFRGPPGEPRNRLSAPCRRTDGPRCGGSILRSRI